MDRRCTECGTVTERLTPTGVCSWRAGCEHRIMQHTQTMARLTAELEQLDREPCGHTRAEHRAMAPGLDRFLRELREGYGE